MELPPQWTQQNDIEFAHYIKRSHVFVGNVTKCDIEKHYFVNAGNIYTHYCEVESSLTGNLTAMVIGNSYAHNVLPVISSNQLLKKVTSFTAFGCLYVKQPKRNCEGYQNAVNEAVKRIKPDIIYFIQGYVKITNSKLRQKAVSEIWAENFKFAFDFFQQHSSVIITNHQHFRFRIPINAEYLRLKYFGYEANMNARKVPGRTTLDKIQLNVSCSKCLWINYNDFFCRNDYCTPIDPFLRLPMFLDEDHITIIGARRAQDIFENITKKASDKII
uniref:SGNH domain-containing protein n=1 Tax=Panagrolaimus davidi TaxID=227884 RepID=A0A914QSV5_9BILA